MSEHDCQTQIGPGKFCHHPWLLHDGTGPCGKCGCPGYTMLDPSFKPIKPGQRFVTLEFPSEHLAMQFAEGANSTGLVSFMDGSTPFIQWEIRGVWTSDETSKPRRD